MIAQPLHLKRQSYRQLLNEFLEGAPGGDCYHEDRFDNDRYTQQCLLLKTPHSEAKVSLAGLPSVEERSWGWTDRELITFLMSPLNLTRLRNLAEQYERAMRLTDLQGFELGQTLRLVDDVIEQTDQRLAVRGDRVMVKGFDAQAKPLNVNLLESAKSFWVGTMGVAP